MDYDYRLKVVMLGDPAVGKTSLLNINIERIFKKTNIMRRKTDHREDRKDSATILTIFPRDRTSI